jgi:hypothetical protein
LMMISSGITHYPVGLTAPPPKSISAVATPDVVPTFG